MGNSTRATPTANNPSVTTDNVVVVWPDEEDEPVAGPVPDPSERTWRHPSEIGAGMAAAANPTPAEAEITVIPDPTRNRSALWPAAVLGGCISVAALGVVALYLVATPATLTQTAGGDSITDAATTGAESPLLPDDEAAAAENGDDPTADADANEPTVDRDKSDQAAPNAASDAEDTTGHDEADSDSTSDTTGSERERGLVDDLLAGKVDQLEAAPGDETIDFGSAGADGESSEDTEDEESYGLLADKSDPLDGAFGSTVDPNDPSGSNNEAPDSQVASVGPGVFGTPDNGGAPLAGLTAVEGLLMTSAGALGGLDQVYLPIDGRWVTVEVVATDPWTDLALLATPTGSDPAAGIDPIDLQAVPAAAIGAAVMIGDAIRIGTEQSGRAPGPRAPKWHDAETPNQAVSISGQVTDLTKPVESGSGLIFHDLIGSDIPFETGFAGMPLFDDEGQAVGLIVNGLRSHNVSAIPIDQVVRYGTSLREIGVADPASIGCDLVETDEGLVEVVSVEPSGPADGLLLPGDRVLVFDGVDVQDHGHLMTLIRDAGIGTTVEVVVERDGRTVATPLTIGAVG